MTHPTYHHTRAALARHLSDAIGISLGAAKVRVTRAIQAGEILEVELRTAVDAQCVVAGFDECLPPTVYQDGYWEDAGLHTWIVAPEWWVEKQKTATT